MLESGRKFFLNFFPRNRLSFSRVYVRNAAGNLLVPCRLIYIPSKLFVHGNAAATASNIAAHEWLFRFGIVADLFCSVILIFLTLALYRLFKGVDQNLAVLMLGQVIRELDGYLHNRILRHADEMLNRENPPGTKANTLPKTQANA
jgi:Domain of unknown function (DUF4386)